MNEEEQREAQRTVVDRMWKVQARLEKLHPKMNWENFLQYLQALHGVRGVFLQRLQNINRHVPTQFNDATHVHRKGSQAIQLMAGTYPKYYHKVAELLDLNADLIDRLEQIDPPEGRMHIPGVRRWQVDHVMEIQMKLQPMEQLLEEVMQYLGEPA